MQKPIQSFEMLKSMHTAARTAPYNFVEFSVTNVGGVLHLKSSNMPGYQFDLTEETFNQIQQSNSPFFPSLDAAKADHKKKYQNEVELATSKYIMYEDVFIEALIRTAYNAESDPEYGNPAHADAIKLAAKHYHPEIEL